ncbi:RNase adapter RapZ [Fuchsiella alkaliacetigena]|uniref:RNase adapter RapZ n=1 Tax=Fuchsiella alkaliacetigena TaxID=957042 RepID=UPI0027E37677|nr:RNase adapter RapZ [Fuchsiella alkaliacetigena]
MKDMKFVIVTGMSGAGKSEAARIFEDLGFFCIDNLPPALITKFTELCLQSRGKVDRVALVMDIRGGDFFDDLSEELAALEKKKIKCEILFLEADTNSLIQRYKETRRRHPLAKEGRVLDAIEAERERLKNLRGQADKIINTSHLSIKDLKEELELSFAQDKQVNKINISLVSFGFKYGIPIDSDLVFDVRFLPNPHYVNDLRPLTGNDPQVQDYVLKWPVAKKFKQKFFDMIEFLIPEYIKEGKNHLSIAIGCTGGKHRSVTLVNKLFDFLAQNDYHIVKENRDIDKDT